MTREGIILGKAEGRVYDYRIILDYELLDDRKHGFHVFFTALSIFKCLIDIIIN